MSEPPSSASGPSGEISALRVDLAALARQLELLSIRVAALEGGARTGYTEETVSNFTLVSHSAAPVPGDTVVDHIGDQQEGSNQAQSWAEREQAAADIGRFLVRAIAGNHRGNSGRDRIRQASKFYIVCKTFAGAVHTHPVLIFSKFSDVKALCCRGDDWGSSVFVGLPSQREISVCLASAGYTRPSASA